MQRRRAPPDQRNPWSASRRKPNPGRGEGITRVRAKNHPNRATPQPMPVTSVGTIPQARVSLYVTFDSATLARDQRGGLPFGDGPPAIPPP
ncbi:hypothetical protein B7486_04640 [cyanobacterium TDX16]|nr:hypothetical protein B7486_04640 [cyanobacterium TDX16]